MEAAWQSFYNMCKICIAVRNRVMANDNKDVSRLERTDRVMLRLICSVFPSDHTSTVTLY